MNSPQREAVLKKFFKQLGFQSHNIKLTTERAESSWLTP